VSAALHFAREDGLDPAPPVTSVQHDGSLVSIIVPFFDSAGKADRLLSTLARITWICVTQQFARCLQAAYR
jgi:hypothetical protein